MSASKAELQVKNKALQAQLSEALCRKRAADALCEMWRVRINKATAKLAALPWWKRILLRDVERILQG